MKYFLKTYGCQMNVSDSERIMSVLELAGFEKTSEEKEAGLIILNICSVRQSAVDRIFGNVKKYNKYRKNNPNFKTIITGCILEKDRKKFEKLFDLVIDIKEIEKLPLLCHSEFISESIQNFKKDNTVQDNHNVSGIKTRQSANQGKIPELNSGQTLKQSLSRTCFGIHDDKADYFKITPQHQSRFTAYVPIMTGCNNFCSYCVVPYTRGKEYSRPAEEILREITDLINKGYKEIVLLGQNVNSYKSSIKNRESEILKRTLSFLRKQESAVALDIPKYANHNNKSNLANWIPASAGMTKTTEAKKLINFQLLLRLINDIPSNFWIRFLTSHPKDMTEELIKTVARCDKCAEYIHLALQSGDNEILKKMNRKYTAEHFLSLIELIRKYMPDAAITTDIIVGFPGETEEQFLHTAEIMKNAHFDMAYINKYSPRAGTTAAKLDDSVSWREKKRREKILTEILKETALKNNKKYVDSAVEVLIYESGIKNSELGIIYGRTRSFKNVKIDSEIGNWKLEIKAGEFVKVKITKAGAWGLEGEIIKN